VKLKLKENLIVLSEKSLAMTFYIYMKDIEVDSTFLTEIL